MHVAALYRNAVPAAFAVLCLLASWASGLPWDFLAAELVVRLARNSLLVLSLIIPVVAGLGLNFGIVLGAMAAQIGLISVVHFGTAGIPGLLLSAVISTPLAALLGYAASLVLNRAKGREMITAMMLGFFMDGVYQLALLFGAGSIIPVRNPDIILESGVGVRNTIDLKTLAGSLDRLIWFRVGPVDVPVANLAVAALVATAIVTLSRTKLGQDMRAVGQDIQVARMAGIRVDRVRVIAIMISTVLACWGQLVFLQNIGTLNTYFSHDQVGQFAIASLLVGGASVARATWANAIAGTILFHALFVVSPIAGQRLLASPQVGEFFRVFVAYGIIAGALAVNAWQTKDVRKQAA